MYVFQSSFKKKMQPGLLKSCFYLNFHIVISDKEFNMELLHFHYLFVLSVSITAIAKFVLIAILQLLIAIVCYHIWKGNMVSN